MAIQLSVAARNGKLDAVETVIGASAILYIRSGAPPANCAAADTGTLLSTINLPADWMNAAASGSKTKLGTWQDSAADAAGVAGHFRIKDSGGTTCHLQGTCSESGGGGDMILDNTDIGVGQVVTVNTFTLNEGNA